LGIEIFFFSPNNKMTKKEEPAPFPTWLAITLVIGLLVLIGLGGMGVPSENKRIAQYKRLGGIY